MEIGQWLPALAGRPQVVEKCYRLFADSFEPTLTPSLGSIQSILDEVALQDPRARAIEPESLIERVL